MRKLLLAVAVTLGVVRLAQATCDTTTTCFTALDVSGNTAVGSLTVSGTAALTGVLNTATSTPYAIKFSSVTAAVPAGSPSAANILAVTTGSVLYISTGTGPGAWVKVGAQ